MNPEQAARTLAAGCQAWQVPAPVAESSVLDLIIGYRTSPRFVEAFARANQRHTDARRQLADREAELRTNVRRLAERREKRLDDYRATRGSTQALQRVAEATRGLYAAESVVDEIRVDADSLHAESARLLEHTADPAIIARQWDAGTEPRRHILTTWIDRIVVEILGEQRGAPRRLCVYPWLEPEKALIAEIV